MKSRMFMVLKKEKNVKMISVYCTKKIKFTFYLNPGSILEI